MAKTKTTHKEVYVIGPPESGGMLLFSPRYYTDYNLAEQIVGERRSNGESVQLFTLFEYVKEN